MELNDLSLEQLMKVNAYLNEPTLPYAVKRILITEVMSGEDRAQYTDPDGDQDVTNELVDAWCARYHDTLFSVRLGDDGEALGMELKLNLTKCPMPELEMNELPPGMPTWYAMFYACSDGWANMTIYELSYVWAAMDRFQQDGKPEQLCQALAVVYRPSRPTTDAELMSDWHGDRRRPLYGEESSIGARAKAFANVHPYALSVLWLWLVSCRAQIIERYPVIFENGSKVAPDPDAADFGWAGLMLAVADGPVNLEQVANHKWSTIFLHLAKLEADRLEAERKRGRRKGQ